MKKVHVFTSLFFIMFISSGCGLTKDDLANVKDDLAKKITELEKQQKIAEENTQKTVAFLNFYIEQKNRLYAGFATCQTEHYYDLSQCYRVDDKSQKSQRAQQACKESWRKSVLCGKKEEKLFTENMNKYSQKECGIDVVPEDPNSLADYDKDGMPDRMELEVGLNPCSATSFGNTKDVNPYHK